MSINQINQEGKPTIDSKEDIVFGTNEDLKETLNPDDLLDQYNKLSGETVVIRELRDTNEYQIEDILNRMLEICDEDGYSVIKVLDKKTDKNGKLVSFGLGAKTEKYKGCFVRLNFLRNCSYGKGDGSDETCILPEFYEDDTFKSPFFAEDSINY